MQSWKQFALPVISRLYYAPCLACSAFFGSLVTPMCDGTSYAQVHELPQSHCDDNWEGISHCFYDCIYIYIYIWYSFWATVFRFHIESWPRVGFESTTFRLCLYQLHIYNDYEKFEAHVFQEKRNIQERLVHWKRSGTDKNSLEWFE